jgi:hypothetical protein
MEHESEREKGDGRAERKRSSVRGERKHRGEK